MPQNFKRTFINGQIRAKEVRLIDETGAQLGVIKIEEALQMAKDRNSDLIQVTEKVDPPVCKIMDYGKYSYRQEKKKKEEKKHQKGGEMKTIRLSFNISIHDMETRVRQAEKFLKKGSVVKIKLRLSGREKALQEVAKGKISKFIEILQEKVPVKTEKEIKREGRGLTMTIMKDTTQRNAVVAPKAETSNRVDQSTPIS
ncbi:MAG: translation initiation factor IF-3 [Candidatus Nealsonbacteria bacterium CG07_land_8_20_14_0_80_39_13]|nr:MAG: translation initiation factor IF-3 [Candidatus Nealsonbacteria bacterium CG07_land_8_20_14_0_80_39_13]